MVQCTERRLLLQPVPMSGDLSLKPKNELNIHVQAGLPNIVLFCYMYIKDLLALFFKITPKKVRLMEHNIPPSRWI